MGKSSSIAGFRRHRLRPYFEIFEQRNLLTLVLYPVNYPVGSYVGVGFQRNEVGDLTGYDGSYSPGTVPTGYSVSINWGDGSTSSGEIAPGTQFGIVRLLGSHIYATPNQDPITVTVNGPNNEYASAQTATADAVVMPSSTSQPISVPTSFNQSAPLVESDFPGLSDYDLNFPVNSYAGVGFQLNEVGTLTGLIGRRTARLSRPD
jgi:hypothetical protein